MEPIFSVVIPAYNEENNIRNTLTEVVNYFQGSDQAFEILVSDDGSSDATTQIVRDVIQENPHIFLLNNHHRGKASALASGILKSRGKYVLMMDADSAAAITELPKLYQPFINNNLDAVIGSREGHLAKRVGEPRYRHLMGRVFNRLIKTMTGLNYNDTQCGFKLFRASVLKALLSKSIIMNRQIENLREPMVTAFDVELLILCKLLNYSVTEVPINWRYVKTRNVQPLRDSWRMIREIMEIRTNLARGVYDR